MSVKALKGVSLGGLIIIEYPALKAGPILRVIIVVGKFYTVMILQMLTDSLNIRIVKPV